MAGAAYLTTEQLAEYLGRSKDTIRRWRYLGEGPRGVRHGRRVMYAMAVVQQWEAEQAARELAGRAR